MKKGKSNKKRLTKLKEPLKGKSKNKRNVISWIFYLTFKNSSKHAIRTLITWTYYWQFWISSNKQSCWVYGKVFNNSEN